MLDGSPTDRDVPVDLKDEVADTATNAKDRKKPDKKPSQGPGKQPSPPGDESRSPAASDPAGATAGSAAGDLPAGGSGGSGSGGDNDGGDNDGGVPLPNLGDLFGDDLADHAGPALVVETGTNSNSVLVQDTLPDSMFAFPLQKSVPFPNLMMPLLLDSPRTREIIAKAEAHNGYVFLVLQRDPEAEVKAATDLHEVGVITRIIKTLKLPDGGMSAMTQGVRRARRIKVVREQPQLVVRVQQLVEIPAQDERSQSVFRLLQKQLQELAALQEHLDPGFATALLNVEDPGQLADFSAGIVRKVADRQRLLAEADVGKRCELALEFAMAESELAALDQKIHEEIRQKAEKAQKDYFLREQLKIIRRELGEEKDPRTMELQRLEQAVQAAKMPDDAKRRAQEELTRLQTTPVESGEYSVIRNYLDWLVALPWSKSTKDHADLARAARVRACQSAAPARSSADCAASKCAKAVARSEHTAASWPRWWATGP